MGKKWEYILSGCFSSHFPALVNGLLIQKLQEFQCLFPLLNHELFEGKNCVLYP